MAVRRRPSGVVWAAVLVLVSVCAIPPGSGGVRPSDHGLAFQKNTTAVAPQMAAFFRGEGGTARPEARNATGISDWEARVTPAAASGGGRRDRLRTALLTFAVACGAAGVTLLAAAALAYVVQARREKARRRAHVPEGVGARASLGT